MQRLCAISRPLFFSSRRVQSGLSVVPSGAQYAVVVTKGKGKAESLLNPAELLEKEGGRIIQILRSRAEERNRLISEDVC